MPEGAAEALKLTVKALPFTLLEAETAYAISRNVVRLAGNASIMKTFLCAAGVNGGLGEGEADVNFKVKKPAYSSINLLPDFTHILHRKHPGPGEKSIRERVLKTEQ